MNYQSEMLKYWEQYNSQISEKDELTFVEKKEIFFHKMRDEVICVSIAKNNEGKYHLQSSYFIGIDWIPETLNTIYIAPKLNTKLKEDGTPDDNVRFEDIQETDYLKMLFDALKHPEIATKHIDHLFAIKWDQPYIEITQTQDLLTPLLVVQFLRVMQQIVRKGLKKSYYKIEQNLNCRVKGKILVGSTIKQNILKNKPLNTNCTFDEFGINGLENRLLKKALLFVYRYIPTLKIQSSEKFTSEMFNYIMPAFESVSEEVSLHDIKHRKTNVFYKEYEEGILLAKLILKRFGYNISNTQQNTILTPPFWIDMSKLFELYVLGLLKNRFGNEVVYHFTTNYQELDYLIKSKDCQMVVDAKYKIKYKNHYDKEDIRQISGYARMKSVYKEFKKPENEIIDCLIIYPDQGEKLCSLEPDLKRIPIDEFVQFYKVPVKLPLLNQAN